MIEATYAVNLHQIELIINQLLKLYWIYKVDIVIKIPTHLSLSKYCHHSGVTH